MEGIRLNGTFGSYRESKVSTTVDDGGRPVRVKPGDKVFVSFVDANREARFFPDPNQVRIDRPMENYIHYGVGPHACLGGEASRVALTAMLKVVGRLDNLRRAPGPAGELKKIPRPGGFYIYMRADHGSYWPFPTSKLSFPVRHNLPRANIENSNENQLGWRTAPAEEEEVVDQVRSKVPCEVDFHVTHAGLGC